MRIVGGGPPYHKLGRRVIYDAKALDEWMDARQRISTNRQANGVAGVCSTNG